MITDKKRQFAELYALEKNATKAAIGAGYSPKTAASQGSRLLTDVDVREYVLKLNAAVETRLAQNTEHVIASLSEVLGYQTQVMRAATPDQKPDVVRNGLKAAAGLQTHYEGDRDKAPLTVNVAVLLAEKAPPEALGSAAKALLSGVTIAG